jgi:hypothetical protein
MSTRLERKARLASPEGFAHGSASSPPPAGNGLMPGKSELSVPSVPTTVASRPGFNPMRLLALINGAITTIGLDLSDFAVLTEAATGAYAVTPVIAAMAGARKVVAVTKSSRYGSVADVRQQTLDLAQRAGVTKRIEIVEDVPREGVLPFEIATNSGHLRPLDADLIDRLPSGAVIALMFEAWEIRDEDLDLAACRRGGVPVVGVNERHPSVDVFSFLAPLSVSLMHDAGVAVYRSRIAVLCDNPFADSICYGLTYSGAEVTVLTSFEALAPGPWDAVLCAFQPHVGPPLDAYAARSIAACAPYAVVVHLWGDVERSALAEFNVGCWPLQPPRPGHMVAMSKIGPEPIIRLQAAGLCAAERVVRHGPNVADPLVQIV